MIDNGYESYKLPALIGLTFTKIVGMEEQSEEIVFEEQSGRRFIMEHMSECCETVFLENIEGNVETLINTPILGAVVSFENVDDEKANDDSVTLSFYRFETIKGFVILRWLGESNGYYQETPRFYEDRGLHSYILYEVGLVENV